MKMKAFLRVFAPSAHNESGTNWGLPEPAELSEISTPAWMEITRHWLPAGAELMSLHRNAGWMSFNRPIFRMMILPVDTERIRWERCAGIPPYLTILLAWLQERIGLPQMGSTKARP